MSFDAGSVAATLRGDFNPAAFMAFDAAMKKAGSTMTAFERKMETSAQRSSRSLHAIGTAAKVGAGAGVLALGAALVKSVALAADFEQQLSSLKSVSGATATQMGTLRKAAMDAGAATKFSALDAAKAQTELAKGGLSVSKILGGGLKGALSLAAAGELDLADAAATTANALNLFGLNGSKAGHVADALATAANTTTGDVHDFAMALTQGGAAAKNVGLDLDQTVVVLEALAQAGVKGSDAGTSMKAAFTQISKPTTESAETMKRLGLEFFTAQGSMKSLPAIAKELDQAFGGLTDKQRLAAATTIAGTDGMRALLALYDASPKSLQVYADQLHKQGTAAEVAAEKQDNFKGKLENFKGSVETAGIAIGSRLLPGLAQLAVEATDTLNRLGETGQIDRFAASAESGFGTAVDVLGDVAGAGADVAGVLFDIGRALDLGDADKLTSIVAGIAAFKTAGVVAPMVATFARSVVTAAAAARLYGASNLAGTLLASTNPITAVSLAAAGLAAGLVYLTSRESSEEAAAHRSAAAKRDQLSAFKALQDAERASVDAKFAAQRSTIELERAEQRLAKVRKDPHASVTDLKDAELELAEARKHSTDAHGAYNEQLAKERDNQQKVINAATHRVAVSREEVEAAKKRLESNRNDPRFADQLAAAERRYADALHDVGKAIGVAENAAANRQRIEAGRKPVSVANTEGFKLASILVGELPKEVRTRYILDDQGAMAKVGLLGVQLGKLHGFQVVTRILAKAENAQAAVSAFKAALDGVKPNTVARIQTTAKSAATEVRAFRAIAQGVPTKKVLSILSNANSEKAAMQALGAAINALQSRRITIETERIERVRRVGSAPPGADTGRRARGRGPTGAETALTGEGRGPELVGNADKGWQVVDRPTLIALAADDYVIPFGDPAQSGRALGLMMDMLGISGYAKGKKGGKGGKKGGGKSGPKPLPIPDAVTFAAVPEDALTNDRDNARKSYQDRKETLHKLDGKIKDQHRNVAEAKGGPAKRKATQKLRDLQEDRRNYERGTGGVKNSLAALKRQYENLQRQLSVLHKANLEIEKLNAQQEAARAQMETAAKTGDAGAWGAARSKRAGLLATLRDKYDLAVKHAKTDTRFAAELEGKLAGVQGDIADVDAAAFEAPDLFDGAGMTKAERDAFAGIEARGALAALTAPLDDDRAAAAEKVGFLEQILGAAMNDPSRGGPSAIADLAGQLKTARENLAAFTGGSAANDNADLQAQIDQQRQRADIAERNVQINAQALSVFQGAGDIGMGGPRIVQNINTLHPGDPRTLDAVASAAVGGMRQQAYVPKTRTSLGF